MLTIDNVIGSMLTCYFPNQRICMNFSPAQYATMLKYLGFQVMNERMICYNDEFFLEEKLVDLNNLTIRFKDKDNSIFKNLEKAEIIFVFDNNCFNRSILNEIQLSVLVDKLGLRISNNKIISHDNTRLMYELFPESAFNHSDKCFCILPKLIPIQFRE